MLCTDLTLPVMIVLSGITLTLGFPAESRHENCTDKSLEPIIIKVNNVIAKLYENEKELEMYHPSFSQLSLPKKKKPSHSGSLNCGKLQGKVSQLRRNITKISERLQCLISLEMSPNFKKHKNEGRVKLLKKLLAEIKNLLVELTHYRKVRNKKRKKSLTRRMPKEESGNLSHIKSQTALKIEEWKLLENLKMILLNWSRNFNFPGIRAGGACEICDADTHLQRASKRHLKFL